MNRIRDYYYIVMCIVLFCSCGDEKKLIERYINEEGKIVEKAFYSDGKLKEVTHYSKDTLYDGERIFYHPNGNIRLKSIYRNHKSHGLASSYYPSGNQETLINHYNGSRVGDAVWFYPDGIIPNTFSFYDSLGIVKYLCEYDSSGSVKYEEGDFMLNYSIDKGEIDPNEAITVNVCTVNPPSLKIDAALCNLNTDGDSIVSGSATYPSVQEDNCYTFEKVYKEEGFYKFALVLKITNELTGEVYPKVLREYDWAVNVWK